ncbi:DEAD/DEAH box helicase [Microbacterium awajiense]|uniref:DEAD/DEAH box helicase n=1 Tax=Microbacterium awajiense TaxID=415214 RepID=A0ABP7A4S7_9MICO
MAWRRVLGATPDSGTADATPLALGVELRQRTRRSDSSWSPVRIETATARGIHRHGADVLVGLRPLERSTRTGGWIKGDVSWETLRRPTARYDARQARWFAELFSIARDMRTFGTFTDVSEWLTLDEVESSLLWAHLTGAEAAGIPLTSTTRRQTVAVAAAGSVALRVERDDGPVRVTPRIEIDGRPTDAASIRPIGSTGVYRFVAHGDRIALTLAPAPLTPPVVSLLAKGVEVTVPVEDADEFLATHLPRIARTTVVEAPGFVIPAVERPVAAVQVEFQPGHRVAWTLRWRYGPDRHEWYAERLGDRDARAESEIGDRLRGVWERAAPIEFAAQGTVSGIDAGEFATTLLPRLEAEPDIAVEIRGTRPAYRELAGDPRIAVSTVESDDPDWFELGVVVTIDGRSIPFAALFTALTLGRRKMMLSDGAYFSLTHPALQRLKDLIGEAGELAEWEARPRIHRYQTDVWADFEDLADESESAVSWRATVEGLRTAAGVPHVPSPRGLRARLRPYQSTGYDWLCFLWEHRLGGILADDMGLGKTLQILAMISRTRDTGETRPFLVVAPTSVLSTWRAEAERFTPDLRVTVIDTTRAKRGGSVADAVRSADIVVTSYTLLRLDDAEFSAVAWAGLVLDEAQFVKNSTTKAYRAAKSLTADVVFAVTGTPLENSLNELWALLSLTAPGLFPSARRFREDYVGPIEKGKVPENQEGSRFRTGRLARLRRRIRPLVLRRTKEQVASELPPKQEQQLAVELSAAHRARYDAVLQRERQKVLGLLDDLDRNRFIVFRSLTLLRLLSLAPGLVDPADTEIEPSKLTALFERLDEALAEGHRVLVFSQFTSFLGLVSTRLDERGIRCAYLDGATQDRDAAIATFRAGEAPVFLISLKAGGFGLTLTEADYVFLLDPWWNPAAEEQAIDRAHRIGQERTVMVYRLIAAGTIEEKVMALQRRKARLFRSVLDDDALFSRELSADDIRGLFED